MHTFITRLLPLLFLFCHFDPAAAQQRTPDLKLGDVVVSGFSGTVAVERPGAKPSIDYTFINPDGPSARVIDIGKPGHVWDGSLLQAPKTFDVLAKDVGQVFGIALDDANPPNIYLAATSVFGLNIVSRGRDGVLERRKKGGPGAVWMLGQFGLELQGGPGAIYKVDGRTGVVTLFANVTLDGVPNPGPALGNLAYDAAHKQLFVSDLYTGMIHRFALDGRELGQPFDHGVTGRPTHGDVPAQPFNPRTRLNIATPRFNSEDPDTWDYAPPARRVWALAVHEGRLYYSARNGAPNDGPQIWSVGVESDGNFAADPRWELDVPTQPGPYAVSDIAFSRQGAMILAQRGKITASYDYSAFTFAGEPRVLRYWLKDKNDPPSPGRWKPEPEEYAVGFAGNDRNTNGGVALGYGYDRNGNMSQGACEAALWTTGQNLRNNPALRSQLEPGGPLVVHGLQGSPADLVRNANTPPAISYFIDYDDKFDDPRDSGHMGSVRAYVTPCAPAAIASPPPPPAPIATPIGCIGPNCRNTCKPTCICPPGTVLEGKECVKRDCPDGQVYNPATNACACPPHTMWINGECRREIMNIPPQGCTPPMIQIPGGPCVCPQGTVLVNGHCVPQTTSCTPPLVLDPATGTCVCPQGTVRQGRQCVPQACPATMIPGPCECPDGTQNEDGICVPVNKVDLGIEKTGGTTPQWDVGAYDFMIKVTNLGDPINGSNVVTVTDVVPTGMRFDSATGTNWTCIPIPATGPTMITCTYTGSGPIATNQALPIITIGATALGPAPFPPYTNCAVVGTAPGSGYVDTNAGNNQSCITVTKPNPDNGSLVLKKLVVSHSAIGLPPMTFPVTVTCGGNATTVTLPSDGTPQTVSNIPLNTSCTVQEGSFTTPPNACPPNLNPAWTTTYSPASPVTVTGPNTQETITNILDCERGGQVAVQKTIDNRTKADLTGASFPATLSCGGTTTSLTLTLPGPQIRHNVPVGTVCSVVETLPPAPTTGCPPNSVPTWMAPQYSPANTTVVAGAGAVLNVLNILYCKPVAETPKPACDARSTIPRDNMCACRYDGMEHTSPTMCMCKTGKLEPGKGCVTPNACPPPKVPGPTPGSCICGPGYKARGEGCVKVLTCGEHSTPNRAGTSCLCNAGYVKKGDMCVPRKKEKERRDEPRVTPGGVIQMVPGLLPGGSRGGGGGGGQQNGATPGKR